MIRKLLVAAIVALHATIALGQLSVSTKNVSQIVGIDSAENIGGVLFVDNSTTVAKKNVVLVFADTEAANVTFEVSDQQRSLVPFEQIDESVISISKSGKSWVEIVAIDFERQIYSKKIVVVELSGSSPSIDVIPDNVKNDYGLGLTAYTFAPDENKEAVAGIYEAAAEFLYGRPEAKTVAESLKWIQEQTKSVVTKEDQWMEWQSKISDALLKSQEDRVGGYSRENWYQAFNEIALALRAAK